LGEFTIQRTPTPLSCLTKDDSFLLLPLDKWIGEWRGWELFKKFNRLITNDEDKKRLFSNWSTKQESCSLHT